MTNGIYIAATGMISRSRSLNITGNNLANLETAGYKRDETTTKSFGEHMVYYLASGETARPLGDCTHGVATDRTVTQYAQGGIEETRRSMDLAINGNGYFTMAVPGGTALTRNGRFFLNNEGYLTDTAGNRVLGVNGPIRLQSDRFTVDESGGVYESNMLTNQLRITVPANPDAVQKQGEGFYAYAGAAANFDGRIVQGALEASNVNLTSEMAGMIEDSRAFQTCAQVVRTMDEMMAKGAQLGSLK